jgi:hypothetical protein
MSLILFLLFKVENHIPSLFKSRHFLDQVIMFILILLMFINLFFEIINFFKKIFVLLKGIEKDQPVPILCKWYNVNNETKEVVEIQGVTGAFY